MALPIADASTSLYVMDENTQRRLCDLATVLNNGTDTERDMGHKLNLILDDLVRYKGDELYST